MESNKKTVKKFSKEFKQESVNRSYEFGIQKTCDELGIGFSTLTRWRSEFAPSKSNKSNTKPSYEDLEKEVKKLKKEMTNMEEINRK